MPSAVPIFLKMADEKQVIYFTWPNYRFFLTIFCCKEMVRINWLRLYFILIQKCYIYALDR